jgi:ribosomal protein S18 acetylase RimI-like enzyme
MAGEDHATGRADAALRGGYAVRPMEVADAPTVAEVHIRVWREAYSTLMPAEHLADLDVADLAARWRQRLREPADGVRHLAGIDPGRRIVGIGTAGPSRDPEPVTGWELWALNVLASEHGTGLADLLLSELIGSDDCSLWVLRGNARAVAFYQRHGFVGDGGTKLHPPTGLTEERMVRIGSV